MRQEIVGAQALSLTLLGSAAAGTFVPGRHQVHNALVLPAIDLQRLRQLAKAMPRFRRLAIAPPLVLTPEYIRSSLDTFPLELLEMQQQHLTVLGEDCFQPLGVRRQIRPAAMRARTQGHGAGHASGRSRPKGMKSDYSISTSTRPTGLLRILRGMLWLKGSRQARPAAEVVTEIETAVTRPLPAFVHCCTSKTAQVGQTYCELHADLDALGNATDAW